MVLGTRFNEPIGRPVGTELEGRELLRRLANGDLSALTDLGITPPEGFRTTTCEWGLGKFPDGLLRIVQGDTGGVIWQRDVIGLAHSHPTIPGRELSVPGVSIEDLLAGRAGADYMDLVHVFPSASDIIYSARRQLPVHEVNVPFAYLGEGRIGNLDPAHPEQAITFRIVDAQVAHHFNEFPVAHCSLELWAGGKLAWHGVLWGAEPFNSNAVQQTFPSIAKPGAPPNYKPY